jgi:hypothetical protein
MPTSSFLSVPSCTRTPSPSTVQSTDAPPRIATPGDGDQLRPSQFLSVSGMPVGRKEREGLRIHFDPLVVARKGEGWEDMLQGVLGKWVAEVGRELRAQSGARDGEVGAGLGEGQKFAVDRELQAARSEAT